MVHSGSLYIFLLLAHPYSFLFPGCENVLSFISAGWLLLLVILAATNASFQPEDPTMSITADANVLVLPPGATMATTSALLSSSSVTQIQSPPHLNLAAHRQITLMSSNYISPAIY